MGDVARYGHWSMVVGSVVVLTVVLVIVNAVNGDPLISSTYAVAAPIALVVCLVALAAIKRRA